MFLRLQHHPRQTRVHRQLAELTTLRGQLVGRGLLVGGDRPQLFQQAHAVLDIAFIRRFDEREGGDVAQPQRGHLQDDRCQVGTQNFRVGKFRTRQEIVFRIETNTDPFRDASAAAFTLVGGGLGHRLNRQALHFGAVAVAADTRRAGVDDIFNARYGQRGFRHVGRQHDAAAAVGLEHAVLLAVRQTGIQRQDLGMTQVALAQRVGGIADFAFAAHKDQNIARAFVPQLVHCVEDGL
ncbi:hypothetical protein D3C76_1118930 [compost metagenome]